MTAFWKTMVVAAVFVVAGFVSGCAQSDGGKKEAVAGANAAFADLRTSTQAAESMGSPSPAWSDEKLVAYDELMTRIENSIARAQTFDGKHGIVIRDDDRLAEQKQAAQAGRDLVKKFRAQRRLVLIESLQADLPTLTTLPAASWPSEKIADLERVVDRAESTSNALDAISVNEPELILVAKTSDLVRLQRAEIAKIRR